MQRIIIIGESAAALKVGAKINRLDPSAEIVLLSRDGSDFVNAGPGSPASLTGDRPDVSLEFLAPRGVKPIVGEVVNMDVRNREVLVNAEHGNLPLRYSSLVLAQTARYDAPDYHVPADNSYVWPAEDDVRRLSQFIENSKPRTGVVVGADFACLSLVDVLRKKDIEPTWLIPDEDGLAWFDRDMIGVIANRLDKVEGLNVLFGPKVERVVAKAGSVTGLELQGGLNLNADFYVFAGRGSAQCPLADELELKRTKSGRIWVDRHFGTSIPGIYAVGDLAALPHVLGGFDYYPCGPRLHLQSAGILAENICGQSLSRPMSGGTFCAEIAGVHLARTGLSISEAASVGYDPEFAVFRGRDKDSGDFDLVVKLIADKPGRRILGVQAVGGPGAEAAVAAAAMGMGKSVTVDDAAVLDLGGDTSADAPLARAAGYVINKLRGRILGITPDELIESEQDGAEFFLMDVREPGEWAKGHLSGAVNIPLTQLKDRVMDDVPRFTPLVVYSEVSDRAYVAASMLVGMGAKQVYVLDGGIGLWPYEIEISTKIA